MLRPAWDPLDGVFAISDSLQRTEILPQLGGPRQRTETLLSSYPRSEIHQNPSFFLVKHAVRAVSRIVLLMSVM